MASGDEDLESAKFGAFEAFQHNKTGGNTQNVNRNMGSGNITTIGPIYGDMTQNIHHYIDDLKHVAGAAFNDYGVGAQPCHQDTRVHLLRDIEDWAESHGDNIFWLKGKAGTGKSSIASTIATHFAQKRNPRIKLGASFFFNKNVKDRASAALFFPTIAQQLCRVVPEFGIHVKKDLDRYIHEKALGEQCERLLTQPLKQLKPSKSQPVYVIAVDALDECDSVKDVEILLRLWHLTSEIKTFHLRWFVTSRPGVSLEQKFLFIRDYRQMVLDEVPQQEIRHDIAIYLKHEFGLIKKCYDHDNPFDNPLSDDWPGEVVLKQLTEIADRLFIIAATLVRFVQDENENAVEQLQEILRSNSFKRFSGISDMYLPILERAIAPFDKQKLEQFRLILGSVITVIEPLSIDTLADLLQLSPSTVNLRINSLRSVLHIPRFDHLPVTIFHLSLAEFLVSDDIRNQPFHIDSGEAHETLLSNCLQLFSRVQPQGLRENICRLSHAGCSRDEISIKDIQDYISPALQYACRCWVSHAKGSGRSIVDNDEIHVFLQTHLLHWLEALSLLDRLADAITQVEILQSLVQNDSQIAVFLEDARRFILANRHIINIAPLQLYSSAIIFSPHRSVVRNFCGQIPDWISQTPTTTETWGPELQQLGGHKLPVMSTEFSPVDSSKLMSASLDETIRLWNAKTGQEIQKFTGHAYGVTHACFSSDGLYLASSSYDRTVRLWDISTGRQLEVFTGHTGPVNKVMFLPRNERLVSCSSDGTVRLWDVNSGKQITCLTGHNHADLLSIATSNGLILASASRRESLITLWHENKNFQPQKLLGHGPKVVDIALSPDGSQLASGFFDGVVKIWDTTSGQSMKIHVEKLHSPHVMYAPDSQLLAFTANSRIMVAKKNGEIVKKLGTKPHHSELEEYWKVKFTPDGSKLLSSRRNGHIQLWDLLSQQRWDFCGHWAPIIDVSFSNDGQTLVSTASDETTRLWKINDTIQSNFETPSHSNAKSLVGSDLDLSIFDEKDRDTWSIRCMALSSNYSTLVLADADYLYIWNEARELKTCLNEDPDYDYSRSDPDYNAALVFSRNGNLLAVAKSLGAVQLWDVTTATMKQEIKTKCHDVSKVIFSVDDKLLALDKGEGGFYLLDLQLERIVCHVQGEQALYYNSKMKPHHGQDLDRSRYDQFIKEIVSRPHCPALKDGWLMFGTKKMLRLPLALHENAYLAQEDVLALRPRSELLTFLRFQHS